IPVEFNIRFPDRLGAKFQFMGPKADDAKAGDFSAAVSASYAARSLSGSRGTDPTLITSSSYEFKRKLVDASLILGARVSDSVLIYGGPFVFLSPYIIKQNLTGSVN